MDNLDSLFNKKQYDLVVSLTELSDDPKERFLRISSLMALGKNDAALDEIEKDLSFKVETFELVHAVKTFGYKIFSEDKIISYGLDSGLCENILYLAKDSDLFICECSYLPAQDPDFNHLNPKAAALIAKEAKVKLLALIHFKADVYDSFEKRDEALLEAGKYFEKTFAPYDGDTITL